MELSNQRDVDACFAVLRQVLDARQLPPDAQRSALDRLTTPGFAQWTFDTLLGEIGELRESGERNNGLFLRVCMQEVEYLLEASFARDARGEWRQQTLLSACPVCFAGVLSDAAECTFCDGTGFDA